ncbi:ribonuclease P protein component [Olleya sp. YS]|uniref:ribonuclease P protein component n=1 Tax=Olleya sp. YS TaxID=3028318 RepID=UPI0024341EDF|nr:ribonuclease P protein component [Olleya sp. YS]WGD35817.1 ribonuclease P protein component [Olleya sp. YS]
MRFTFNKHDKLKSQKAIEQLFAEGQSISAYPLRMVYLKNDDALKVGVSVSKRYFKKAVDRNRIKRLLREGYRLNKTMLIDNNIDHCTLMILYISKDMPDFKLVDAKIKTLLSKFKDQIVKS